MYISKLKFRKFIFVTKKRKRNMEKKMLKKTMNYVMEAILFLVMVGHVIICPFTKVEESFNLQAMHDLLFHGHDIAMYDHLEYPGVVPRTFLGPIVIAGFSYPFLYLSMLFELSKFFMQYVVRLILGTMVLIAFNKFKNGVERQFGSNVSLWLQVITASQFHMMFYMSRPLPNTFALILALHAFHYWLTDNQRMFLFTSAAAVIIFRAELSILLGFIALGQLVSGHLSILAVICWGLPAAIWMLGLTVAVDSFFWMRPVWPEGEVLWFNIFLNKSSEWGTSPWAWYFYSALPRALLSSTFLIPFSFVLDYRIRAILYPALGFVVVYSFLPHKELRFIIYAVPLLNVAAARSCDCLWNNWQKSLIAKSLIIMTFMHIILNICVTLWILSISYHNYPGGYAIMKLHEIEGNERDVSVHIDVFCAQTGVSRFTELKPDWWYDKTEDLLPRSQEIMKFSHLLMEYPDSPFPYESTHTVLDFITGYSHWYLDFNSYFPPKIFTKPKALILKKAIPYPSVIINSTKIKSLKF